MGVNERERGRPSGTLYNSIVTFGADGRLLGTHRKLVPTSTERLVWSRGDGVDPERHILAGGSAIIGPDGRCLAGPLGTEEAILYADLDLARIPAEHLTFDAVGHYGRPNVFTLTVNTAPLTSLDTGG